MYKVIKRDGSVADFDIQKIRRAIIKAFESVDRSYTDDTIDFIVLKVTADFEKKLNKETGTLGAEYKHDTIAVEDIQDSVETVLIKSGYDQVAKSFILYREKHAKMRSVRNTLMDYKRTMEQYLGGSDWRVKENSTVTYSVGGLILNQSGAVTANYWLSEIYDAEIANAHRNCDMHIHDLCMLAPYCCGHNLKQLITEGLNGVPSKVSSSPATHLSTLCNQMVNYLGIEQNEWAGAQAFSSFDTLLAPFVKKDNLSYKEVKQCIQSFVYGVNTPSRWGCVPTSYKLLMDDSEWCDYDAYLKRCTKEAGAKYVAIDPDGNEQIVSPYGVLKKEYSGEMYEVIIVEDPNYKQVITKNHRLLLFDHLYKKYVLVDAEFAYVNKLSEVVLDSCNNRFVLPFFEYHNGNRYMVKSPAWIMRPKQVDKIDVWCPSSHLGTAIFKNEIGCLIATGQTQSPFSNITLDWNCPADLKDQPAIVGGVEQDFTYGDCKAEMDMINKAFMEIMNEGDYDGKLFSYPIPTYSITKDFDWSESENLKLLFGMAAKYGIPYFSNYINSDMNPQDVRSMCPLTGDTEVLIRKDGAICVDNIKSLYEDKLLGNFEVWDGNDWVHAKINKQDPTPICEIRCNSKTVARMGINHLQPVYIGDAPSTDSELTVVRAEDLMPGMYLPFASTVKGMYTFEKVGAIWYSDPEELYCFEVDSDNHYFMLANGLITHNCRLRLDLREIIKKKGGGFFGSGDKTGSTGVVTLNFPKLAYLSKDKEDFYKRLDNLMDIAARSLAIKRETVTRLMENGLYPYTKRYIGSFDTYFNTIATVGMNEMCLNAKWINKNIASKEGQEFTIEVLHHILDRLPKYQQEYGYLFNLESAPAESTCYRLAKHDKEKYPDIKTAGTNEVPYYTNSSNLPVGYTANLYEALEHQDPIQTLYTSGTVFHIYLGEKLPDWKAAATIIKKVCENYRLPYITLSPTFSVCPEHGYIPGEHTTCPHCK